MIVLVKPSPPPVSEINNEALEKLKVRFKHIQNLKVSSIKRKIMHYKKLVFLLLPITVTKFINNFNLGCEQKGAFTFKVVNSQASNSVIVTVR